MRWPELDTDAALDLWFDGYRLQYEAAWRLYPDVIPTFDMLDARFPGLAMGVLSNGDRSQQRSKLMRLGIADRLPVILTSSEIGFSKPDPRAFTIACQRLGIIPERVAYTGDRLEVDAMAATSAGLRGIWLSRSLNHADQVPTIHRLQDLGEAIGSNRWVGDVNDAGGVRNCDCSS